MQCCMCAPCRRLLRTIRGGRSGRQGSSDVVRAGGQLRAQARQIARQAVEQAARKVVLRGKGGAQRGERSGQQRPRGVGESGVQHPTQQQVNEVVEACARGVLVPTRLHVTPQRVSHAHGSESAFIAFQRAGLLTRRP